MTTEYKFVQKYIRGKIHVAYFRFGKLEKMKKKTAIINMFVISFLLVGCSTPIDTTPSHTRELAPDQADDVGGSFLESSDIRTMAQQICSELLGLPEIAESSGKARIATDKIKNSTRYIIDTDILLRRLRLELSKYSQGKIRFFVQGGNQVTRTRIIKERNQTQLEPLLTKMARYLASSDVISKATEPVRISINPVANTNLYNMNANSFISLLRSKIKKIAGDKVLFAQPNSGAKVDYTLTGEFIARSIKREGIANTVEDLKWAQENPEKWQNNDLNSQSNTVQGVQVNLNTSNVNRVKVGPNTVYGTIDPALWESPNVTKVFNVMLVDAESIAVLEKTITIEEQIKSGQENAGYILTGEIGALSKAGQGQRSDYVLVSIYLVDPISNEIIWEYGYEVKRETKRSVLYR